MNNTKITNWLDSIAIVQLFLSCFKSSTSPMVIYTDKKPKNLDLTTNFGIQKYMHQNNCITK